MEIWVKGEEGGVSEMGEEEEEGGTVKGWFWLVIFIILGIMVHLVLQ